MQNLDEKILEDFTEAEKAQYDAYAKWCEETDFGKVLTEGWVSDKVSAVIQFAKAVAKACKSKVRDILAYLKDKRVFKVFSLLGFSIKKLWEYGKKALDTWKQIVHFIPDLLTDLAAQGIDLASKKLDPSGKLPQILKAIKEWMAKHRILMIVGGIAFGVLLIMIWRQMSFVGDPGYDFDFQSIVDAFLGRFTLVDFLLSKDGLKTLILLATGVLGFSFPWVGDITLIIALIHFISKKVRAHFSSKEPTSDEEIAQDLSSVVS